MSYDSDMALIDGMVKTVLGRKHLIESVSYKHSDNWQDVSTPYDICGEMCDLVVGKADMYIVFFALEFLEVLIFEKGIDPKSIIFIGDFNIECGLASKMYGAKVVTITKNDVIKEGKFCKEPFIKLFTSEIDMKFNKVAVLGNPPYNANSNGKDSIPIYHLFVEAVIDNIKPDYFSFIIPSRWMVGGKGLDKHRERMMNDRHMKKIVHFAGEREIFNTVSIKGGANYFLWSKEHDGECEFVNGNTTTNRFLNEYDIIVQDNNALSLLKKVLKASSKFVSQTCLSRKPFGLRSNFSDFKESGVKCIAIKQTEYFVDPHAFTDNNNALHMWKVCTSKATSEGNITSNKSGAMSVATNFFILEPDSICTETYLVVNKFPTRKEAENFILYMKTKFFRFMLLLRLATQNISKDSFGWCPLLNYSESWTDKELSEHFNLTRQEVAYIESKIKTI